MKEGDEIAAISQRLTELKLREKMVTWVFHNHKNWSEEKINAVLDEKTRTVLPKGSYKKELL